jgi:cellulose synthase/poly-beta-1,6-N-acetylglucosamine synthase-like glycosyltransferase
MPVSCPEPVVSIILPTYNRAKFLPQAFDSIRSQTWTDWELIVVDDGSRDDTAAVVEQLASETGRPVRYVWQENAGPAAARNAGLDRARGKYVAFFDSDDYWLAHHLKDCVGALEGNPEVAWVFCAGRRVDYHTKQVLIEHDFYQDGLRSRFLDLRTRRAGGLHIFEDPCLLQCALRGAGFGGLQSTVARREVFARLRFESVAFFEDRLALIRAIALGIPIGYLDEVHVLIYSHGANVSFASEKQLESYVAAMHAYLAALETLRRELPLTRRESRSLHAKAGEESFWNLGYFLARRGRHRDGLRWMRYGLRCCPLNLAFWKTYLVSCLRAALA